MKNGETSRAWTMVRVVVVWGGLWGIFESTFGYLLHLLPWSVGWLVWYPVACFFMANVYRHTKSAGSVVGVGVLAAAIKMLNLFLPGRIDTVINPAISIVFESVSAALILLAASRVGQDKGNRLLQWTWKVICMNTLWRIMYMLYLLFLVPQWMRDVSVVSSMEKFLMSFVVHNLITSTLLIAAVVVRKKVFGVIGILEGKLQDVEDGIPRKLVPLAQTAVGVLLIGVSIALQIYV